VRHGSENEERRQKENALVYNENLWNEIRGLASFDSLLQVLVGPAQQAWRGHLDARIISVSFLAAYSL
jgi:hypothetical protein